MKNIIPGTMLQQSFPFKLQRGCNQAIKPILENSLFLKVLRESLISVDIIVHQSSFIRYFDQSSCFLDSFFQNSFLLNAFSKSFFTLSEFFADFIQLAFRNSFVQKKGQSIAKDFLQYSIRPLVFALFAYLSIRASMQMAFGQGLNRSEVLVIFSFLLALWILSHARIPATWFSERSHFIAFLKDLVS